VPVRFPPQDEALDGREVIEHRLLRRALVVRADRAEDAAVVLVRALRPARRVE